MDGLQEELEVVQHQGGELMAACGEPDRPVIKKSLDEVWEIRLKLFISTFCGVFVQIYVHVLLADDIYVFFQVVSAWENLNKAWKERGERLEEAMQAAVQFQDGLQVFFFFKH